MAAAATSVLSMYSTAAFADSGADAVASNSPGVLSGNNVQVPVDAPLNLCGNSVDVVGLLNPAFGNSCAIGGKGADGPEASGMADAADSPGVVSGNNVQVPVDAPLNLCGNSVDVVGALNPVSDNSCGIGGEGADVPQASGIADAEDSPGVVSGNNVQVPVDAPLNLCGNSVDVVGALNPVSGNSCGIGGEGADVPQASGIADAADSPGVVSGNNVQLPVSLPANLCGNSVDVVGVLNPVTGNSCAVEGPAAGVPQQPGDGGVVNPPSGPANPPTGPANPPGGVANPPGGVANPPGGVTNPPGGVANPPGGVVNPPGNSSGVPLTPPAVEEPATPEQPAVNEPQAPSGVPAQPRATLANTGSEGALAASAVGAALIAGGVALYRRGRAAYRR